MKIIHNNIWFSLFATQSYREFSELISKQQHAMVLELGKVASGLYYYCLMGKDSLTQYDIFSIRFSSDDEPKNIYFLICDNSFILSTGSILYFVSQNIKIERSLILSAPLIGLHVIEKERILILDELSCRITSLDGEIIAEHHFDDTIEDFKLAKESLLVKIHDRWITLKLL